MMYRSDLEFISGVMLMAVALSAGHETEGRRVPVSRGYHVDFMYIGYPRWLRGFICSTLPVSLSRRTFSFEVAIGLLWPVGI